MFNITNHYGNTNQNYKEIPPHTHQDDYYKKKKQQPKPENNVGKDMEKLNPCALLVRM